MSPTLFGRACRPYPIIAYIRPRLPPYRALILTVPAALCRWYTNSIDSSVHLTQHSYRGIVINHTLILIHRACCPVSSWQVGIITPTDMLNEMEMEATDDVMRFSGSGGGASSVSITFHIGLPSLSCPAESLTVKQLPLSLAVVTETPRSLRPLTDWTLSSAMHAVATSSPGESYFGTSLVQLVTARAGWLISLLMLQSLSSVILTRFSALIEVRA